ncbi:MAG TPA: hypothetical protein VHY31_18875 [Streptosporangiaceae bacterium]|nr:hypothetical protein [Streptosporangiaceae bacterium]
MSRRATARRRGRTAGSPLSAMPARMAAPPSTWTRVTGSANTTAPAIAPTSGSRLRNAPATLAGTRVWPKANSVNGSTVPHSASPAKASSGAGLTGRAGSRSVARATGAVANAAARNWAPVTATGSRSRRSRLCATVNAALASCETMTRASPPNVAPPPWPSATRPTPASDTANPAQAAGLVTVRCQSAAMTAISIGEVPTIRAACVTLVCCRPMFCAATDAP